MDDFTDPETDNSRRTGRWMYVVAWLLLLALFYSFFSDRIERLYNPNQQLQGQVVNGVPEVQLKRNRQGHYLTQAQINGHPVVMLVDTGATEISIPSSVAERLELPDGARVPVNTANGRVTVRQTRISQLDIGPLRWRDLSAHINPGYQGEEILLGMNALKHLELIQRDGVLTLRQY
ncbi:retropepsin-like aspartic protease family protein [Aliagarivorans marinus]|uniref:retropepsin-like aspartic protease family protein n=1 Tax=Aliagarivorans marinus TaxID=561965 RepID=UPI00040D7D4E|nr:TIGR02281 family clan AA aspartic protease [Aliagarivorans marinus]